MKKILLLVIASSVFLSANAQYYYLDIIGTQQTNQIYRTIKANQLKKISAVSYEGSSTLSDDFVLEQSITDNQIITKTKAINNSPSFFIGTYAANKLVRTLDSSSNAIVRVDYQYNSDGRISTVSSVSKDFDGTFVTTEDHIWQYNSNGQPEKMLKVKNAVDTTVITFIYDEQGNIAKEIWKKNDRVKETYYYYYNKNKLTDIARFNTRAQQMLPDFIFEYDNSGKLIQMTQAQHTKANYLIYKYVYNDRGLKEKELIFDKQKQLLGKVEYKYQ